MSAVPYDVAEQFMRGRTARSGAFVSMGDALYSYGLKIAHWTEDGLVWDIDPDAKAPSVTTARHIRAARGVLPTPNECRAMKLRNPLTPAENFRRQVAGFSGVEQ